MRGIPWAYTWRELKDLFAEIGDIERADVVYGDDGRSRVRASCVGGGGRAGHVERGSSRWA